MLTALIFMSAFVVGSPDDSNAPAGKRDLVTPVWVDDDEDDQATLAKRVERLECQHLMDRIDIDNLENEVIALRLAGPISDRDRAALQKRRSEILHRTAETIQKDAGVRFRHCHDLIDAGR